VAWSGDRRPDSDGRVPSVGNTVDVNRATWSNSIGSPELITVWEDPDFDPGERAFHYARVIEIPTPRWTAYEAFRFGIEMPDEVPMDAGTCLHEPDLVHANRLGHEIAVPVQSDRSRG
jgi:hypothetical protein